MSNRPEPKIECLWRLVAEFRKANYLDKPRIAEQAFGVAAEVISEMDRRLKNLERINGV